MVRKRHSVSAKLMRLALSLRCNQTKKVSEDRKAQVQKILEDSCSTSVASRSALLVFLLTSIRPFEFDRFQDYQAADASGKRKVFISLEESGMKCLDWTSEMVSNNSAETGEVESKRKCFFTRQWLGARCSEFYYV